MRIARAFSAEIVNLSINAPRKVERRECLEGRCREIIEQTGDPRVKGTLLFHLGFTSQVSCEFKRVIEYFEEAEPILSTQCTGVAWELATMQSVGIEALWSLGRWKEVAALVPRICHDAQTRGDIHTEVIVKLAAGSFVYLMRDDPAGMREEADRAIAKWDRGNYDFHHVVRLRYQVLADLYEGKGVQAYERVCAEWHRPKRAFLFRVPLIRTTFTWLRGASALAVVQESGRVNPRTLRMAKRDAESLKKDSTRWGDALGDLLLGGIAMTQEDEAEAAEQFKCAADRFQLLGMRGYEAVARMGYGQAIGGDEGRGIVSESVAWMEGAQVKSVPSIVRMLAPGIYLD